jgi:hypothetical protein
MATTRRLAGGRSSDRLSVRKGRLPLGAGGTPLDWRRPSVNGSAYSATKFRTRTPKPRAGRWSGSWYGRRSTFGSRRTPPGASESSPSERSTAGVASVFAGLIDALGHPDSGLPKQQDRRFRVGPGAQSSVHCPSRTAKRSQRWTHQPIGKWSPREFSGLQSPTKNKIL